MDTVIIFFFLGIAGGLIFLTKKYIDSVFEYAKSVDALLAVTNDRVEGSLCKIAAHIDRLDREVGKRPRGVVEDPDSSLWALLDEIRTSMRTADAQLLRRIDGVGVDYKELQKIKEAGECPSRWMS